MDRRGFQDEVTATRSVAGRWMQGQELDITHLVREGNNRMVVLVTNTLINRVSHLTEAIPFPKELVPHYGGPLSVRPYPQSSTMGFRPLPASGLMGPVTIRVARRVRVPLR